MKWYTLVSGNIVQRVLCFANLAAILSISSPVYSQCGGGTTVTLSSQTQVNSFLSSYCTDFNGNLRIVDDNDGVGNIVDLTPLAGLVNVRRNLWIENNQALTSLNGLNQLQSVGFNLIIINNPLLVNLDGLMSLHTIWRHCDIGDNPGLISIQGLSNLSFVGWTLELDNNDALTNVSGLSALTDIGIDLNIYNNAVLANLDALSSLNSVQSLKILRNPALSHINGLSNLHSVKWISINDNDNLIHIDGLQNIQGNIIGSINVIENEKLKNLNGLTPITNIGSTLNISNNASLTNLDGLNSLSSVGETLYLEHNPRIKNTNGFSNLKTLVNGHLYIQYNDSLTNIKFPALKTIKYSILITNNNRLTSITDFHNLAFLGTSFRIHFNSSLQVIDGFSKVKSITESITILSNPLLGEIHAMDSLHTVTGRLIIDNNPQLEILNAFSQLNSVGQEIDVQNNSSLSMCCNLYNIMHRELITGGLAVGGPINIFSNLPGCNSFTEILNNGGCPVPGCMDPTAHNFNAQATVDDGSCETCSDGILNGDEVNIDCGGSLCNPCPAPVAVCGNIVDVYIGPSDLVFNGPGLADIYLVDAADLDVGSISSNPAGVTRLVKRDNTVIGINWTTNGACVDATPNSIHNNNDKGIVYRSCLPVIHSDFNNIRNFSMTITDPFGTSTCSGRYRVNFSATNAPFLSQLPPADFMETEGLDIITLYPNPGSDELNIAFNLDREQLETCRIEISDGLGRLISQYAAISSRVIKVPMHDYMPGVYTIICHTAESRASSIWVKY